MNSVLALATFFISYANGANDDFKGVATLYGSKVLSYNRALAWGLIATFAGSIASFFMTTRLLTLFSGKGIVQNAILQDPAFLTTVALAAACTVMLATLLRFPISTTHSLVGALMGCGIASGGLTSFTALGKSFFVPLLLGPVAALFLTTLLYRVCHRLRLRTGVQSSYCLCIGETQEVLIGAPGLLTIQSSGVRVSIAEQKHCRIIYPGHFMGVNLQKAMDLIHMFSAGAVSLARGMNDTPKLAALFLAIPFVSPKIGLLSVAIFMTAGGLIHSKRIAQRMSFEVTEMNPGQAFTGNFVTAALVLFGSLFGLPLSTTHVSCGALFGIGIVNRTARKSVILQILLAWLLTLPAAAILAAIFWYGLRTESRL